MKFCPKCNSVMKAKGNRMVCIRCGYEEEEVGRIQFKERISHDKDRTIVADGKVINGRVAISLCPRCGSTRAILLKKRLYKCMVCNLIYTI